MDTILVVDDDVHTAELLALLLSEEGLTVLTAGSGQEALMIAHHLEQIIRVGLLPRVKPWVEELDDAVGADVLGHHELHRPPRPPGSTS